MFCSLQSTQKTKEKAIDFGKSGLIYCHKTMLRAHQCLNVHKKEGILLYYLHSTLFS